MQENDSKPYTIDCIETKWNPNTLKSVETLWKMLEYIRKVKHDKNMADQKNDSIPPRGAHDSGILTGEAAWRQIYSWAEAPPAQEGCFLNNTNNKPIKYMETNWNRNTLNMLQHDRKSYAPNCIDTHISPNMLKMLETDGKSHTNNYIDTQWHPNPLKSVETL